MSARVLRSICVVRLAARLVSIVFVVTAVSTASADPGAIVAPNDATAATSAPPPAEAAALPVQAAPQAATPAPGFQPPPVTTTPATMSPAPTASRTAQVAPCKQKEDNTEGFGQFLIGFGLFDFSALNDRLAAHEYERIRGGLTLIGGEAHAVFESGFVAVGRGAAIIGPDGSGPDGLNTHLGGGFGMLDLGFALAHTRSWLFAVLAGIGGYGLNLAIEDERTIDFDELLATPERGTSLSRGGVLVGATLAVDGRIPLGQPDERGHRGFFSLGLRVGGLFGPAMGDWSQPEGASATGGPDGGLAGGFGVLVIGFGGGPAR